MMVKRKKVIPAKARHPTEGNENNNSEQRLFRRRRQ